LSEKTVFELEDFLNNDQKDFLDDYSKKNSLQVLQLKKQFIQDSYDKLSFVTKDNYEIDSKIIEAEQEKDFRISKQIRSLNDSSIVCAKRGYTAPCECGLLNQIPILCGNRKLCPTCNKKYSRKLMKKIYRVLTSVPNSWWAEVVLTYPKKYFDIDNLVKVYPKNKKIAKVFLQDSCLKKHEIMNLMFKEANKWLREVYGIKIKGVKGKRAGVGCVVICHSLKSENPLSEENHFHVHILIPDFVFFPIVEKSLIPCKRINIDLKKDTVKVKTITRTDRTFIGYGEIRRIRFHKSKEQMTKDRKIWQDILKYYESDVDVYFEYFNCKKKLMHKITYNVRGAVKDFNDHFLKEENQHIEMTPEHVKRFDYHADFPFGFKRVRYYGFLSNSQRKKFLDTVTHPKLREMLDPLYKTFEVCSGCFRRFSGFGSEEMDFDEKTMKRTLRMDLVTYENYHKCKMKKD